MMTESGVNTGFGGSADTRTTKSEGLKDYLLNGLLYGALKRYFINLCHGSVQVLQESN